jgi:hypothetical protein
MKRRELFVSFLSPWNRYFLHQKCLGPPNLYCLIQPACDHKRKNIVGNQMFHATGQLEMLVL